MRKRLRKWLPIIGAVSIGLAILLIAENNVVQSFQDCIAKQAAAQSTNNPLKSRFIVGRFLERQSVCTVGFLDDHNGFVAALAGLAVAIFTFTLWQSTEKLWAAGERQLTETRRSADAAVQSAEIAERTLTITQRAYVFLREPRSAALAAAPEAPIHTLRLWVVWENGGNTPARNTLHVIGASFVERVEDYGFGTTSPSGVTGTIGPRAQINSAIIDIERAAAEAVWKGERHLFLWGWTKYKDMFSLVTDHFVEFSFKVRIEGNFAPNQLLVHFDVYGEHNRHYDQV